MFIVLFDAQNYDISYLKIELSGGFSVVVAY